MKIQTSRGAVTVRAAALAENDYLPRNQAIARTAAGVAARRMFGRRGDVVTIRPDGGAADGSTATYQAAIGYPAVGGGWNVVDVLVYV
jgi:hypothetical protein